MTMTSIQDLPKRQIQSRRWIRKVAPQNMASVIKTASQWSVFSWIAVVAVTVSLVMSIFYKLPISLAIVASVLSVNASFYELYRAKLKQDFKKTSTDEKNT